VSQRQTRTAPSGDAVALAAPNAATVSLTGSFCGWDPVGHPLHCDRHGVWKTTLALPPGRYEHRFLVDGQWRDKPTYPERVPNRFGTENCVLPV
jgi:1,4-alpha-glucan branching enzyme